MRDSSPIRRESTSIVSGESSTTRAERQLSGACVLGGIVGGERVRQNGDLSVELVVRFEERHRVVAPPAGGATEPDEVEGV